LASVASLARGGALVAESAEIDHDLLRAQQRIGQVFRGKYRIDRVLGVGGMAAVYAATHRNQKQFAIKVLHPELSHREDIRTRFLREGYAANSVRHAGAVAVLDDDVAEDGSAFLVMELLDGLSVEQAAAQTDGRLAVTYVLGIAHQVLDTLASAHAQGIVHRDIKPANLFLTSEGQVKVLDFGIARVRDAATTGANATRTGLLLGTPAFMAPEQAMGRSSEIDAQTDLWAVGATLSTLLTGQLVHPGETDQHLMVLAGTTPARPLATVMPQVPSAVATIVDRAVAFGKADRWPSAGAMRDAVREASLSIFARLPLRETLLPIFGDGVDATGQTRHAGSPGESPRVTPRWAPPSALASPHSALAMAAPTPTVPAAAPTKQSGLMPTPSGPGGIGPAVGMTTSHPVSSDPPFSLPAGLPRARPMVLVGVAIAGMLVVAGSVAVGLRSLARSSGSGETAASPEPVAAPLPSASSAASARDDASPSPQQTGSVAAPPRTVVITAASAGTATATATIAGSSRPSATAPASSATTAHPTATAAPCRLVSFFDTDGNKHFRQECP
jgi:serine/threonine protein kinase